MNSWFDDFSRDVLTMRQDALVALPITRIRRSVWKPDHTTSTLICSGVRTEHAVAGRMNSFFQTIAYLILDGCPGKREILA